MATLAKDTPRAYTVYGDERDNDLPVIASDIIYEGAAVGNNASGYSRPLQGADPFQGFALQQVDNSAGAAGAKNVHVRQRGVIELDVVGVDGVDDVEKTVYATDDDTFTLTASGATAIGKVHRHISGTKCEVAFEALSLRSI